MLLIETVRGMLRMVLKEGLVGLDEEDAADEAAAEEKNEAEEEEEAEEDSYEGRACRVYVKVERRGDGVAESSSVRRHRRRGRRHRGDAIATTHAVDAAARATSSRASPHAGGGGGRRGRRGGGTRANLPGPEAQEGRPPRPQRDTAGQKRPPRSARRRRSIAQADTVTPSNWESMLRRSLYGHACTSPRASETRGSRLLPVRIKLEGP